MDLVGLLIALGVNNGMYCNNVLLIQKLLPVRREISGEFVIFQQDRAPAHGACEAISLLEEMNNMLNGSSICLMCGMAVTECYR